MFEQVIESPNGILQWVGNSTERVLTLDVQSAYYFFRNYAVKLGDLTGNAMGMYSLASVGRENEAKWMSMNTPEYLLQTRGAGCSWNPVKGMTTNVDTVAMCPWKLNLEECPDALWNSCLEKILGTGLDIIDWLATPEGSALFNEMIRNIHIGLGNSYFMMAWFGGHGLIDEADDANSWTAKIDPIKWQNFKRNQATCGGLMTAIDALKDANIEHYNVEIRNSELSTDFKTYIGDAKALIDRVIDSATYDFNLVNEMNISEGRYPVIKVTTSIFKRLREQNALTNFAESNMTALNLWLKGKDDEFMLGPNTMMYNGYLIVRDDVQKKFDDVTGTITHRVLLAVNGVYGIAHDTTSIDQFGGLGMRVFQDLRPKEGGKLFMDTYGKIATKIINTDFVVNASRSFVPEFA